MFTSVSFHATPNKFSERNDFTVQANAIDYSDLGVGLGECLSLQLRANNDELWIYATLEQAEKIRDALDQWIMDMKLRQAQEPDDEETEDGE